MKKTILMLGILIISPMIIIGCATAKKEIKETEVQEQYQVKEEMIKLDDGTVIKTISNILIDPKISSTAPAESQLRKAEKKAFDRAYKYTPVLQPAPANYKDLGYATYKEMLKDFTGRLKLPASFTV